jgi:hypothetical protein
MVHLLHYDHNLAARRLEVPIIVVRRIVRLARRPVERLRPELGRAVEFRGLAIDYDSAEPASMHGSTPS